MRPSWTAAIDAAIPYLRCPACKDVVRREGAVLRCPLRHSFDLARQGYVNLKPPKSRAAGDEPAMLDARARFLAAGHYGPVRDTLAEAVASAVADMVPGCVVDAGAGTGWYLAGVLDRMPDRVGVALDVAQGALRRAAAAHERAAAVGCDLWARLPLGDSVAAALMVVFAPRNPEEFARVLHRQGRLFVVTPTDRHLAEAREVLGLLDVQPDKASVLDTALSPHFDLVAETVVEHQMALTREDAQALAAMGPSSRHASPEDFTARLADVSDPWPVTASVRLSVHRAR